MMMKFTFPLFLFAATGLLLEACELKDPCDPGQKYEYGVCRPGDADEGAAGSPGTCVESAGGAAPTTCPPNPGDSCTEGGDECQGGTVCAAPDLPQCVAVCGPGEPFEDECPEGLTCTDFPQGSICF